MFVLSFLSLFYTSREACEPEICENLRLLLCVSFLDFLLFTASLPYLNFFLSLRFWMCDFFDFWFRFCGVELLFSSCLFFSGWFVVFSVSAATCTAYRMYLIRTARTSFFMVCLRCRCASVNVCTTLCLFDFFTEVFLPLQSYPATTDCIVYCGDELMWEQQQQQLQ